MRDKIEIRKETKEDYLETEELCLRAFCNLHGPGCDEHLLVRKLRMHEDYLPELSRIATIEGKVAATIMYSKAVVKDGDTEYPIITFGPLAVDPMYQNTGVGGALLEYTMELAREEGYPGIAIFGEPGYYPKHGFVTADHFGITDPRGKNYDSLMAFELQEGGFAGVKGKLFESKCFEELTMEEADKLSREYRPILKGVFPCQWTYENACDEKDGYHMEPAEHHLKESRRLFNAYIEELSLYNPWLSTQRDEAGNYLPKIYGDFFKEPEKKMFLVFVEGKAAGFTVMAVPKAEDEPDGCISYIEELYIEKEYRNRGIAKDIVKRFLRQQKGKCGFCVLKKNEVADAIWEALLKKEGYAFTKNGDEKLWFYQVDTGRTQKQK